MNKYNKNKDLNKQRKKYSLRNHITKFNLSIQKMATKITNNKLSYSKINTILGK